MKQVSGTPYFVPDCEEHIISNTRKGIRFFDNYQHDRLEKAFEYVADWSVAVDGGANVGLLTHKMAERFEKVYSFEPAADCYECLLKNTEHLPQVFCSNVALGEEQKIVGLDSGPIDNTGMRQIVPDGEGVPMVTLDSLELPSLGLLKLDVQGYEYWVMRGGKETLKRCQPVCVVEVEDPEKIPRKFGIKDHKKAVNYLAKLGAKFQCRVGHDWIMSW